MIGGRELLDLTMRLSVAIVAGCGLWKLAIVATGMTMLILTALKYSARGG
jgi:uncharacterized membrane protein YhiD involved in acid resistance